jgi:hypothetical protein
MDQTVVATLKRYYTRCIITQVIVPNLREFWKSHNIWKAVNNITVFWAEIKQSTINKSWRCLCPDFVLDDQDIEETPEQKTKDDDELER